MAKNEDFSESQLHELHETIWLRMLKAGWLKAYRYTEGKGWHITWTSLGADQSAGLKIIAETFGLTEHDLAPMAFAKLAKGVALPPEMMLATRPDEVLLDAFAKAMDVLELSHDDEDLLLVLIHAVVGWAPDWGV